MREIKFRAWNKNKEEWETGWSYPTDFDNEAFSARLPEGVRLMQFTGLKDKNGNEIYEGDIVKINNRGVTVEVVEWVKNSCGFEPFSDSGANCGCCGGADRPEDCEVIGNIYENPELIQNK